MDFAKYVSLLSTSALYFARADTFNDTFEGAKGLKIDDMIISVNGVAVAEIPYESQKDFFKKLDEVNLVVKRGDSMENIKFKLESVL